MIYCRIAHHLKFGPCTLVLCGLFHISYLVDCTIFFIGYAFLDEEKVGGENSTRRKAEKGTVRILSVNTRCIAVNESRRKAFGSIVKKKKLVHYTGDDQ